MANTTTKTMTKIGETAKMDVFVVGDFDESEVVVLMARNDDDVACIRRLGEVRWTTKAAARAYADKLAAAESTD